MKKMLLAASAILLASTFALAAPQKPREDEPLPNTFTIYRAKECTGTGAAQICSRIIKSTIDDCLYTQFVDAASVAYSVTPWLYQRTQVCL